MPDLHSLPAGSRPENAIRNNGPDDLALERYKLRELAEGWPCYRWVIKIIGYMKLSLMFLQRRL